MPNTFATSEIASVETLNVGPFKPFKPLNRFASFKTLTDNATSTVVFKSSRSDGVGLAE